MNPTFPQHSDDHAADGTNEATLPLCFRCGKQPCECSDAVTLYCAKSELLLPCLEPDSIDAIVTDPPYGLEFMGKEWDKFGHTGEKWSRRIATGTDWKGKKRTRPGRLYMRSSHLTCQKCRGQKHQHDDARCPDPMFVNEAHEPLQMRAFQAWCEQWATEAYRVLKPGAYLLAFGGTRTYHRLTCAIEDAGFEIRDCIIWMHGQGFPKSLDVSKSIDKAAGAEREVIGVNEHGSGPHRIKLDNHGEGDTGIGYMDGSGKVFDMTVPATAAARQWNGYGTALKPAYEPIVVARKPLAGTVAENVQRYGTGALNIDGCRVGFQDGERETLYRPMTENKSVGWKNTSQAMGYNTPDGLPPSAGRFPANLIHDGSEEVVGMFPETETHSTGNQSPLEASTKTGVGGMFGVLGGASAYPGDTGSAARFFYAAKASREERGKGNTHPTVKPLALMEYLCRLLSQPGHKGVLLDPFAGSGSTLLCASRWFERAIGIEQDEASCRIAASRLSQSTETQRGLL